MMTQIKILLILLVLTCCNTFVSAQDDSAAVENIQQYSTGFEREHIAAVREQVKRVGWNALSIETQLKQSLSNNYSKPIRTETVKAALLGGVENVQQAFEDINAALSVEPETQTSQVWFQTLQTYDCLRSLPESVSVSSELIQKTDQLLNTYIQSLYTITPSQEDPYTIAIHQAACAYAAVITQDEEQIETWLHGNETVPPLWKRLGEAVPNEGVGNFDKVLNGYLFALFSTLRDQSDEEIEVLKPWVTRSLDILNLNMKMTRYNEIGGILDSPDRYWHLSSIERYYNDYSDHTSGEILDGLYKGFSRRADMLLFGKVPWEAPTASEVRSVSSTILPRVGLAYLKDESNDIPVSLLLSTSPRIFTLLSMQPLMYMGNDQHKDFKFNTVVVDQKIQGHWHEDTPQNALVTSFVPFADRGTFISTHSTGIYGERAKYLEDYPGLTFPVTHYQRDIYVDSPYIIDWFRVTGGGTQDYIYQLPGSLNGDHNFDWQSVNLPKDSYPFLQEASAIQSTKPNGVFSVASQPENNGLSERVWFVVNGESELIHAKHDKRDIVINRKEFTQPTANVFAVVHKVAKNEFSNDVTIQPLSLNPQPNESGFQAVAFVIKNGTQEDIFYSSTQPGQTYTTTHNNTEIEFQSKFAHVQLHDGKFQQLRMVGGKQVKFGGHQVIADEVMTTGVINNIDEKTGSFDLSFPYFLPFGDALKNHVLHAVSSEPNTPFLQPLVFSHADDLKGEQRFHLEHRINLSNPPSTLAAPVQHGDQVLLESFAELKKNSEDSFLLYHSSPLQITVPANGTKKRFFVNETNVQRLQGEFKDGLIHASFSPLESYDAKIEVIRVQ